MVNLKQKIAQSLIALLLVVSPAATIATPASAAPSCGDSSSSKGQVLQGIGQTGSDCDDKGVKGAINAVVQVISIIAGIAAVIVIILSGLKYITSGGDSAKISSAKNTLVYALIGLVIAALAQFLVHFVLTAASKT